MKLDKLLNITISVKFDVSGIFNSPSMVCQLMLFWQSNVFLSFINILFVLEHDRRALMLTKYLFFISFLRGTLLENNDVQRNVKLLKLRRRLIKIIIKKTSDE